MMTIKEPPATGSSKTNRSTKRRRSTGKIGKTPSTRPSARRRATSKKEEMIQNHPLFQELKKSWNDLSPEQIGTKLNLVLESLPRQGMQRRVAYLLGKDEKLIRKYMKFAKEAAGTQPITVAQPLATPSEAKLARMPEPGPTIQPIAHEEQDITRLAKHIVDWYQKEQFGLAIAAMVLAEVEDGLDFHRRKKPARNFPPVSDENLPALVAKAEPGPDTDYGNSLRQIYYPARWLFRWLTNAHPSYSILEAAVQRARQDLVAMSRNNI